MTGRLWEVWIVDALAQTRGWVIFVWVFAAFLGFLDGDGHADKAIHLAETIATCYQVAVWGWHAINKWRDTSLAQTTGADVSSVGALGLMSSVIKGVMLIVILLLGLSNSGVDVAALVASFGIGGIAIALASRNILEDLLASISILLDKPFVVGDFIVVGDKLGSVETIGIKTTRLRALSGEQLIFSNKDLLSSRIQNFKRMWQRRVQLRFSVPYSTDAEKLRQVPEWIKGFVKEEAKLKLDRCHLAGYGPSSIDYELIFFVLDPDFNLYMDLQQVLLLKIHRKFSEEGVEFAVPAQRIWIENGRPVQEDGRGGEAESGEKPGPHM